MDRQMIKVFTSVVLTLLLCAVSAEESSTGDRKISAEDLQADFTELYELMQVSHYDLFARRSKREYDARYKAMLASFTRPMSLDDAHVQFQKFLAYGRVAHSRTDGYQGAYSAHRENGGKSMPLGFRIVHGRTYIVDNDSGLSQISPGDELLTLNGEPLKTWLNRLAAYVSADNDYMMHTLMEFDFPALLWLEAGSAEKFDVTVKPGKTGETFDIVVPARSKTQMLSSAGQTAVLDLDWNKREWRLMPRGIAYLRPGPFYNNERDATNMWDTKSFSAFIDAAFEGFIKGNARALVIDLRNNAGGDNSFSDLMVSWFADEPYRFVSAFRIRVSQAAIDANRKRLKQAQQDPDVTSQKFAAAYANRKPGEVIDFEVPFACPRAGTRFDATVFLLINRHSYSNTVMVAALAQDYGFATIVGEETSDLSTTYGAMEQFDLPRTGITIGFPKARIIRPSGGTEARGVIPDIVIPTPIVEGREDPVLARALEIAAQPQRERNSNARATLSRKIAEAAARQLPCSNASAS